MAPEAPITGTGNSDGVMVLLREEGWKEAQIAAFSEVEVLAPDSRKRRHLQREGPRADEPMVRLKAHSYCVGLWDAETFGKHQYAEGLRRGLERLERLSAVNDGAPWIARITGENFASGQFARTFQQAVQIVDWSHSVQRLWLVGNAVYGEGKPAAAAWVNARQDELWAGEVAQVVRALDALPLRALSYADAVSRTPAYFDHNRNSFALCRLPRARLSYREWFG